MDGQHEKQRYNNLVQHEAIMAQTQEKLNRED
jgi:hypothetical protein